MKKQVLEVHLEGSEEPLVVDIDGRDIRRWEEEHDASFITSDVSYTMLTELGYFGAVRAGLESGTKKEWMDKAVSVTQVPAADAARPTQKGRTAKRSSP